MTPRPPLDELLSLLKGLGNRTGDMRDVTQDEAASLAA